MDQSFNDKELSDIMKEIEALEEDFTVTDAAKSPVKDEFSALEDLAAVPEEVAVPTPVAKVKPLEAVSKPAPEKVEHHVKSLSTATTSMSFKVEGNLALDLQFHIGGKVVCLEVKESGLSIEMEGGIKFSVPVSDEHKSKKAA